MKQYWTRTVQAANDLSDDNHFGKAIGLDGDFATNGRETLGILVEGASSGRNITIAVQGIIPYQAIAVISAGTALTVNASGRFVLLTAGEHEVGMALGHKGADAVVVNSAAIGEGNFNFATKPHAAPGSGGAFI